MTLVERECFAPAPQFGRGVVISDPSIYDETAWDPTGWWAGQAEALSWLECWGDVLDDSNPPCGGCYVTSPRGVPLATSPCREIPRSEAT